MVVVGAFTSTTPGNSAESATALCPSMGRSSISLVSINVPRVAELASMAVPLLSTTVTVSFDEPNWRLTTSLIFELASTEMFVTTCASN